MERECGVGRWRNGAKLFRQKVQCSISKRHSFSNGSALGLGYMALEWIAFFLYSTHEPHSSEDCQWGNLFRIMDMIDDGWGNHSIFFFKDNGLALVWASHTARNMVLPPCSFIQWQCASRKSVLYLENFSLNHRENVWNCTNWRKQKIRRAVNKSTQKLIFCRVKAQGAFGCWALL